MDLKVHFKILTHNTEPKVHFKTRCSEIWFRITVILFHLFLTPGVGSKQEPLHVLVVHGSLPVVCPSPLDGSALRQWFKEGAGDDGSQHRVEGVVWHCPSGALYKVLSRLQGCTNGLIEMRRRGVLVLMCVLARQCTHCSWGTCKSDSRFPQLVV